MRSIRKVVGTTAFALIFAALPVFAAPIVTVGSPSVVFAYTAGGAVPPAQAVAVTSDIATTINGTGINYIAGSPGWLSVFPPGPQNTPASLSLSVIPNALAAGTYIAQVNLTPAGAVDPASSLTITVFLTVAGGTGGPPSQTITATPTSLSFSWAAGSALPAPQGLAIKVSDDATFSVTRNSNTLTQWLSVSPSTATSPATIQVSVDPTGLASGTYSGTVTATSSFSVVQVPVTLVISGLGIVASPNVISLSVPQNYGLSSPQSVRLTSGSGGSLPFQTYAASEGNWLQVDVPTGSTPATIQLRANTSGLAQGTYLGTLTVRSGNISSADVGVALTVGPPAAVGLQPAGLSFIYTVGDAAPAVQTTRVSSLSSTPQTITLASSTFDGGNWLAGSVNQSTTPAVVTVQVSPTNLAPGTYYGAVNVTPGVTNASPQPIQVTLTVKAPPPPTIQSVTNSASYGTTSVSPGQFVTLFGTTIGPKDIVVAPAGSLPRSLGNTIVSFDAVPAPILYTSATQTGVQVPYGVTPGQPTSIVVTYNGTNSAARSVPVTEAYPGLFTADSSGKGQAAALNGDFSLNSAANPAARGSVLVLYGTGEGKTTPAVVEGSIVPVVAPIPATQLPVSVTIGGQVAQVLYFGETPGALAGLMQVNVRVPDTAPTGGAVPVLVFVNGIPSQPSVNVAIK